MVIRRALINAAVLVMTLVLCLGIAELVARWLKYRPIPRTYVGQVVERYHENYVADPAIGWKMKPNRRFQYNHTTHVQVNSQGFRAPFDFRRNEVRKVIALVGDSFTFGVGVDYEHTFTSILQESFPSTVVYNFGVPGFGTDQIMDTVRTYALSYKPALIVVSFITDDFQRSLDAFRRVEGFDKPTYKVVKGWPVPKTPADTPGALFRFIESHSALMGAAELASRRLAIKYPVFEWWTLNAAILRKIQADCQAAGTPVLFVLIPTRMRPHFALLHRFMSKMNADFLDLADDNLLPIPGSYMPNDLHPNPQGHRYIAQAIRQWIVGHLPDLTQ